MEAELHLLARYLLQSVGNGLLLFLRGRRDGRHVCDQDASGFIRECAVLVHYCREQHEAVLVDQQQQEVVHVLRELFLEAFLQELLLEFRIDLRIGEELHCLRHGRDALARGLEFIAILHELVLFLRNLEDRLGVFPYKL